MSKNREQKHAKHLAEQKSHEQHRHEEEHVEHHDEHFVEAPKGSSRTRFLFQFLLVVFLLLIFSITGPMMSTLSGEGSSGDDVYMSWTLPGGERQTLTGQEFVMEKRTFRQIEVMFPLLGLRGVDPSNDEHIARLLITEDLAHWSGVSAADDDLAELILTAFLDEKGYRDFIAGRRDLTPVEFERTLARGRTIQRYTQLLSSGANLVSPDKIAEAWKKQNQEYDLQYIELLNEDFTDAARAELPVDEDLQDWFDALSPFQKSRFNSQTSWSADLAWFDTSSDAAMDVLFERFPRPEDEDAEEMARNYYNSNSHVRFVRPEPEEEPEEGAEDSAEEVEKFFSFEEVAEIATREAPIYYSLVDWLTYMQSRIDAGEVVDLQVEAIALGLQFTQVEPRSREGWAEGEEPWAGSFLANSTAPLPEGRLTTRVTVEKNALVVAKLIEKLAPSLPPFADIKEQAGDQWVEERRATLAVEALEALRKPFEAVAAETDAAESDAADVPDEVVVPLTPADATVELEAFKAAVAAAGHTLVERGYRTRYPRPGTNPADALDADNYLQGNSLYYSLEAGALAVPEASRDGKYSYIVRFGGQRDADLSQMDPAELEAMTQQLGRESEMSFYGNTFEDQAWVKEHFQLRLKSWEREEGAPSN